MALRHSWRGDKVAAGKTVNAGAKALEGDDRIGAEAIEIIGGHERNGTDMKRAVTGADDFELCGPGVFSFKGESEFLVMFAQFAKLNRLPRGIGVGTPNDADKNLGPGITRQLNAAIVGFAFNKVNSGLTYAARFGTGEFDQGCVIANEWIVGVHDDGINRAMGFHRPGPTLRRPGPKPPNPPWLALGSSEDLGATA